MHHMVKDAKANKQVDIFINNHDEHVRYKKGYCT